VTAALRELPLRELALRIDTALGGAAYIIYVVEPGEISELSIALCDELENTTLIKSGSAVRLLHDLAHFEGTVVIDAGAYRDADWRLLDRQRSALLRNSPTIFVTTQESLNELMQVAPNIASCLGGNVFIHPPLHVRQTQISSSGNERRAVLRAWSGMTDEDVIQKAESGDLPLDPEYAEWLVLLGRGDLLGA
jgi:hypothetical protein